MVIGYVLLFFFFFVCVFFFFFFGVFFFKAEDGIRFLVRSRGLGDVYKRQVLQRRHSDRDRPVEPVRAVGTADVDLAGDDHVSACLLYTSDAADERSSVDLGGRRIIKKKNRE